MNLKQLEYFVQVAGLRRLCHAVLAASGVAASARPGELVMRRLVDPVAVSVLCLTISAHKRPTPLTQHSMRLLTALVRELPG